MKTLLVVAVAISSFAFSSAYGQVIVENDNVVLDDSLGKLSFSVYKEAQIGSENFTVANFTLAGSELKFDSASLDEGSSWYVVQPGDRFTLQTIASGQFTPLVTLGPQPYPAVTVGEGDFYLGIQTFSFSFNAPSKWALGWVHLRSDGTELSPHVTMISNVMSYDNRGIIIGTTTLVPEPSGLATVAGLGLVAARHRTSRRIRRPLG